MLPVEERLIVEELCAGAVYDLPAEGLVLQERLVVEELCAGTVDDLLADGLVLQGARGNGGRAGT